jgi:hypothetical protein
MRGKKRKAKIGAAVAVELTNPIIVPFRGMLKEHRGEPTSTTMLGDPIWTQVTAENLIREGAIKQMEKLLRLADLYGIDRSGPAGWGFYLALRIATGHLSGFRVVYDDWQARQFYRLHGWTPVYPLRGKSPRSIRNMEYGWAWTSKFLQPEMLAMLFSADRKAKHTTAKEFCEAIVIAADDEMKKRKNRREKESRIATLIRRLTEGRKRLNQKPV